MIRPILHLLVSLMLSWLEYNNEVLVSISSYVVYWLQSVTMLPLGWCANFLIQTLLFHSLHWLQAAHWINFKLASLHVSYRYFQDWRLPISLTSSRACAFSWADVFLLLICDSARHLCILSTSLQNIVWKLTSSHCPFHVCQVVWQRIFSLEGGYFLLDLEVKRII